MAHEKTTCPSCGGMGIGGSVCEYCGSVIQSSTPILEKGLSKTEKKTVSGEQYAEKISKYQTVSEYYGKLAIVSIGQRFGLINRNGDLTVGLEYDNINFLFKSKGLFVLNKKGKCALINDDCSLLLDFQYDKIDALRHSCNQYVLIVKLGNKFALFNINGKSLTDFKYDRIEAIDHGSLVSMIGGINNPKGLFRVSNEKKMGVIDYSGQEIVPCNCSNTKINAFAKNNMFIEVKQGKKVGLFDNIGRNILPCEFHSIQSCYKNERYIYIQKTEASDTLGLFDLKVKKEVIPCVYSFISESFPNIIIERAKKRGIYNVESKKEIIPCRYDKIEYDGVNKLKLFYNNQTEHVLQVELGGDKIVKGDSPKNMTLNFIYGTGLTILAIFVFLFFGTWMAAIFGVPLLWLAYSQFYLYCNSKKYVIQ